ncbi:hypothetical protein [Streptomyces sp. NPDC053560]|uniref:hypothetical protein n=1 Tax=Streptomyces sp. NPDC053560 TaxID=3365711 RepID=UPI0037D795CC
MTAGTGGIAVVGSGSLARAICCSLAVAADPAPDRVTVLARSGEAAQEIAAVAAARAAVSGRPTRFVATTVDAADPDALVRALNSVRPRVVAHCASVQSPWENLHAPSAWTDLLARGGFGVGLPLHALLARRVAEAVRRSAAPALLVNACYPDAVNPLLHAEGLPVLCGVGNAATLAAGLRAALRPEPGRRLRVLAHHAHLHTPGDPGDELRAWLDDGPVAGVTGHLRRHRACSRTELNAVTGHSAAVVLARLAAGDAVQADLPGPLGLPGGYPVRVEGGEVTLDLPAGLTRKDAVDWQMRMAAHDGAVVTPDGETRFGDACRAALAPHLPGEPERYGAGDTAALAGRLLELRARLRTAPAAPAVPHTADLAARLVRS